MQHVMVDLETMDSSPTAAIAAIGAVYMDLNTGELGKTFYEKVDLQSSMDLGLTVSADTIQWWLKQNDAARFEMTQSGESIMRALNRFSDFIGGKWVFDETDGIGSFVPSDVRVWGNGASFDNAVLANAYAKCGKSRPWQYYNDRCYRTIKNMYPHVVLERSGTHHNALDDAISQAKHLVNIIKVSSSPDIGAL
jgi:DNA polymerase III epsilon subunit-like protein